MQQQKKTSQVYKKNTYTKDNIQFKLTPIKELKQKLQTMFQNDSIQKNNIKCTPQKLSSAITNKLKSMSQNCIKFQATIATPKYINKTRQNFRTTCMMNSSKNFQTIDQVNQPKISNLFHFKKKKSYSMQTVTSPYVHLLPYNNHFKQSQPMSKYILKVSKIKQRLNKTQLAEQKTSKILHSQKNLFLLSRKINLRQRKMNNSANTTYPTQQTQQIEIEAHRLNTNQKKRNSKQIIIKPSQIISVKIDNLRNNSLKMKIQNIKKNKIDNDIKEFQNFRQTFEGWRNQQKQQEYQNFVDQLEKRNPQQSIKKIKKNKNREYNTIGFHLKQHQKDQSQFYTRANT